LEIVRDFGETYGFHLQEQKVSQAGDKLSLSPIYARFSFGLLFDCAGMKMKAICSSETLGSFQTTRRYNPEYHTLFRIINSELMVRKGYLSTVHAYLQDLVIYFTELYKSRSKSCAVGCCFNENVRKGSSK
jgi:hypothetical protein